MTEYARSRQLFGLIKNRACRHTLAHRLHTSASRLIRLTCPQRVLNLTQVRDIRLEVYRELEELYRTAKGYEFAWGQIIETDSGAAEGLPACREWEFILTDPLARFHAVGGNLGEVSDLCLSLLDRLRYSATEGLSSADQASAPPECLEFSEGSSSFAAFGVSAFGREPIEIVGKWLEEVFVPAVMPVMLDYLAESAVSMGY